MVGGIGYGSRKSLSYFIWDWDSYGVGSVGQKNRLSWPNSEKSGTRDCICYDSWNANNVGDYSLRSWTALQKLDKSSFLSLALPGRK